MDEKIDMEIAPRETLVTLGSKQYVLREATAAVARRYRNKLLESITYGEDGRIHQAPGIADLEVLLVSGCVFAVNPKGPPTQVGENVVASWPDRVVKALFSQAKDLSGFTAEEKSASEEREKADGDADPTDG